MLEKKRTGGACGKVRCRYCLTIKRTIMEKKHQELSGKAFELGGQIKDAVCERMKELGHIRFNTPRNFPFVDTDGEFKSVIVVELKYDECYYGDVTAIDRNGNEWSVQEECTLDGCLELLYYIEEEAYVKL